MVSKLDILKYFYQIDIDYKNDYFTYQDQLYYLGTVDQYSDIYLMIVKTLGLKGFQRVANCFNHYQSMNHILYHYQIEDYNLNDLLDYSLQPLNQTIKLITIKKSWCHILDLAKEKLDLVLSKINQFEYLVILFYYYQSLGETAISLLNLINSKELLMGLEHHRFENKYSILFNPNNLIYASRIKDLTTAIKKEIISIDDLDQYIHNYQLTNDELIYMFCRILFPDSFMNLVISSNLQVNKIKAELIKMYQNIDQELLVINRLKKQLDLYLKLPDISWLF